MKLFMMGGDADSVCCSQGASYLNLGGDWRGVDDAVVLRKRRREGLDDFDEGADAPPLRRMILACIVAIVVLICLLGTSLVFVLVVKSSFDSAF